MPGKRNTGIVDHAFMHRRSHHRSKARVHAAGRGTIEQCQYVWAICGIQPASGRSRGKRNMQHFQFAGRRRAFGVEFTQARAQPELGCTCGEQFAVSENDSATAEAAVRLRKAYVRANTGGLA